MRKNRKNAQQNKVWAVIKIAAQKNTPNRLCFRRKSPYVTIINVFIWDLDNSGSQNKKGDVFLSGDTKVSVFNDKAMGALAKAYGETPEDLDKELEFFWDHLYEKLANVHNFRQGLILWQQESGDKKANEIMEDPITAFLDSELEVTTSVEDAHKLNYCCPEHISKTTDFDPWKPKTIAKIKQLSLELYEQIKDEMKFSDAVAHRKQCIKGSDAWLRYTEFIEGKIRKKLGYILGFEEGICMWKECKLPKKHKEDEELEPNEDLTELIEAEMSQDSFCNAINMITSTKVIKVIHDFIPKDEGHFEKLKTALKRRHYDLLYFALPEKAD